MATNFLNGVSNQGAPVFPFTTGNIFYVKASGGSDGNDGKTPGNAFATLAYAVSQATANNGDVIIMLPGAHSYSASVALSKAGLTITGLPGNYLRPRASITISASDEIINVTAANCEIANLRIIPITAKTAIDFTTAASNLYIHNNSFDLATPVASTSTLGVGATSATQAPPFLLIDHNYVECDGAQGPAFSVGDAQDYCVSNNLISVKAGTWAAACAGDGVLGFGVWKGNTFLCQQAGAMTIGIRGTDMTSASSVGVLANFFGDDVTVPIDDFAAGDAYIAENYKAGVGGAAGGSLWSSIT